MIKLHRRVWHAEVGVDELECANKEDQPHIPADQLPAVQDEECKLLVKLWGFPNELRFVTSEARKPPLSPGLYLLPLDLVVLSNPRAR